MKSIIANFIAAAVAVLITCSFTETNRSGAAVSAVNATRAGGAHLVFAGKYGGEITQQEMQGQTQLGVDGCAIGSRIFRFTLEVRKSGRTSSYQSKSNALTGEMTAALRSLGTGDEFEFKNIKAYLPNGKDVVDVHSKPFKVVAKKA